MWNKRIPPPYLPRLESPHSTDNIDKVSIEESADVLERASDRNSNRPEA